MIRNAATGLFTPELDKTGFVSSATFLAVAAAIGAGDVMTGAKEFTSIGPQEGGVVEIGTIQLMVADTALIASEAGYDLALYSVTPPSALADNAVWDVPSGDRASYLGKLALGTPVDLGSTLMIETRSVGKQVYVPAGGSLFGYLITAAGFTATATVRTVRLHARKV